MSAVRRAMGPLVLTGMFAAWLLALGPTRFGGPAGYVIVSGHSMEPTFYTGDLVITRENSNYEVGDVVAFHVPEDDVQATGSLIIHRIVGGDGENGFIVQGDNKAAPDTWRPRQSDVVGTKWVHLPGFGRHLARLSEPAYFAGLIAGMSMLCLFGTTKVRSTRRRRHMNGSTHQEHGGAASGRSAPHWALAALGFAVTLTLGFGFLAVTAFSRPNDRMVPSSAVNYEHTSAFDYSVEVSPSTLYPSGKLGPFVAAAPSEGGSSASEVVAPAGQVFFFKLTHRLDFGFHYALVTPVAADVHGETSLQLEVRSVGNPGWTRTGTLLEPLDFQGSDVDTRVSLDLEPIKQMIEAIEAETGYKAPGYELRILPVVHVAGSLGNEPVDDVYAPAFTIKYNNTVFTPDSTLRYAEAKRIGDSMTRPNEIGFGILSVSNALARWLATGMTAMLAVASVGFAAVVCTGFLQDESTKLRARYGTRLVPVTKADHRGSHPVQVASLEDLAVLAARDGKIIFNQKVADGDLFFVPDGPLTYQYSKGKEVQS